MAFILQNEIYFSLSTQAIVTPSVILSRCLVSSRFQMFSKPEEDISVTPSRRKLKKYQGSPLKKRSKFTASSDDGSDGSEEDEQDYCKKVPDDPDKIFYCSLAVDSRRGIFYNFNWERHQKDALALSSVPSNQAGSSSKVDDSQLGKGHCWDVEVKKISLPNKKGQKVEDDGSEPDVSDADEYQDKDSTNESDIEVDGGEITESEHGSQDEDEPDALSAFQTPSKKRKRGRESIATPRNQKVNKTLVQPTPHSKAALVKRRKRNAASASPRKHKSRALFPIRYPEQSLGFQASLSHLPKDPWLRSMHALHVGSRPDTLPCREEEYAKVLRCVGELLEEGSGGCICEFILPSFIKNAC